MELELELETPEILAGIVLDLTDLAGIDNWYWIAIYCIIIGIVFVLRFELELLSILIVLFCIGLAGQLELAAGIWRIGFGDGSRIWIWIWYW